MPTAAPLSMVVSAVPVSAGRVSAVAVPVAGAAVAAHWIGPLACLYIKS